MNYNFDKIINRKNTNCEKWDMIEKSFGSSDVLPLWVADMDFEAPLEVAESIKKRTEHGVFGYTAVPYSYYKAVIDWLKVRHGWEVDRDWISLSHGVIPSLCAAIITFTNPGDKILIQSPVYPPFFSIVKNNGRCLVNNQLKISQGKYIIDFDNLQKQLSEGVKMMILCNPHNPVGRVWSRDELNQIGELCLKYNVMLVSDEIHSDLVYPYVKHIPAGSISEEIAQNSITCVAPSKTFNIPGLGISAVIIPNSRLSKMFNKTVSNMAMNMSSIFGPIAAEAAYKYGADWLDQLLVYLQGNIDFLTQYLKDNIPQIKFFKPEGTYLAWLDCRDLGLDQKELKSFMTNKAKVGLIEGTAFGPGGEGYQRLNFACPRSVLVEALQRIKAAVNDRTT
ncbi:MAG TPA: PatB family C-S lyase [Clostridiales bacterium]|nr:PatB family C-S lyase [Clostridiales bacterium]